MTRFHESTPSEDIKAQGIIVEDIQDMYPYNRFGWFRPEHFIISYLMFYEEIVTGLFC